MARQRSEEEQKAVETILWALGHKIQRLREIPGVSGVNLMTPGPTELLVEAISAAGLADPATKITH